MLYLQSVCFPQQFSSQVVISQYTPQQRQVLQQIPSQQFFQISSIKVHRQCHPSYYAQCEIGNQYSQINYVQNQVKTQPDQLEYNPINQINQRYPPPQVYKQQYQQQQQIVTNPILPQYHFPVQLRGTPQQNYQPQHQPKQTQYPWPQSQNKIIQTPQVIQSQINDLVLPNEADPVEKYQNPESYQPQQQSSPQAKQEQKINKPEIKDNQLQELELQYEDGYIYRGQGYEPAIREGQGILTDQNNNKVYNGQWKDNQYNGKGNLINVQAEEIEGPFDYLDLNVIENGWLDYEGDFFEGKMNGSGRLQLTNGEVFEGQFKDGMIDGTGTFTTVNSQYLKGLWSKGVLTQVFA